MGWSVSYDTNWERDIGYGVPAFCDEPGCDEVIDRGLSYVCCESEPYGGEDGCGLFFCGKHQEIEPLEGGYPACGHGDSYKAKPDHPDWIRHKLTDSTWAEWRADNPEWVADNISSQGTLASVPPQAEKDVCGAPQGEGE